MFCSHTPSVSQLLSCDFQKDIIESGELREHLSKWDFPLPEPSQDLDQVMFCPRTPHSQRLFFIFHTEYMRKLLYLPEFLLFQRYTLGPGAMGRPEIVLK